MTSVVRTPQDHSRRRERACLRRLRDSILLALSCVLLVAPPSQAAEKKGRTGTIKDLEDREIQVTPDPPTDVKPQQAIEQYRRFLEMQTDNPRLRAEAMRRLGDLQLEV